MDALVTVMMFDSVRDGDRVARVLERVWLDGHTYPHPSDHDGSRTALRAWLDRDEQSQPWRAVLVSDDDVVGYVQVTPPHAYLLEHLARSHPDLPLDGCQEIGKLFVDPQRRGHGFGRKLLTAARRVVDGGGGWSALAVVETSPEAIELYVREGLEDVGTFRGRHGINHVFVDSGSPNHPHGR